ncbi:hypothetical protein CWI82_03700 [Pseudidiomarina tainanensis]|uniref:Uncharacterized protein n=1 Tax=Pseudidiomarina tainanensis TaxID=502365 RepID=A0ACD2HIR0_9GAMM|nr:ATPase, T2SS/T4P/T4SS family [Pseudidiomarina tainanensis]RZQ56420.1 hypothetical protein CWI82_03700 [Pseudidiomarina tainanensis]
MYQLNDETLTGLSASQTSLSLCSAVSDQYMQDDVAVLISVEGALIASLPAWQHHFMTLMNIVTQANLNGEVVTQWCLANARSIRNLLHDATAHELQSAHVETVELDHTRAQQSLEDLVQQALVLQASDIHLLFSPTHAALSFRVHGRLVGKVERNRESMAGAIAAALNTRSEDFHELFDEQRLSSASISLSVLDNDSFQRIRLRVQKSPTRNGFAVTMRLQREQSKILRLHELGLSADVVNRLQAILREPSGLLIIAGPTGQGKTTTLAALNAEIPTTAKVISLEDPIEIIQPQIEQKPVIAEHHELNFANMVKVALREDPDVISISEIRDEATAKAAFTAALTGHLVTATVHAHDTFGVLSRLLDLGLSPESLAQFGVVRGILAQRLVANICIDCEGTDRGCPRCHGVGVIGRRIVSEYLPIDNNIRQALLAKQFENCRSELIAQGWQTLDEQLLGAQECI